MEPTNPSPFYDQLVGAEKFSLIFPLSEDCAGPSWLESGELVHSGDCEIETEDIEAVSLGSSRYRLAERCLGPFSSLRLHWGDEFFADRLDGNSLRISKLVFPRPFEHFRYLTSGGFKNSNPILISNEVQPHAFGTKNLRQIHSPQPLRVHSWSRLG